MFLINNTLNNNNNIELNMNILNDKISDKNIHKNLNLFKFNAIHNKLYPFNYSYTPLQYLFYPQINYNLFKNNIIKINTIDSNDIFKEYISDYSNKKYDLYYNDKYKLNDKIKKTQMEYIKKLNKTIIKNGSDISIDSKFHNDYDIDSDIVCIYNDDYFGNNSDKDSGNSDDTITDYPDDDYNLDANKYMDSIFIENNINNFNTIDDIKFINNFFINDETTISNYKETIENKISLEDYIRQNINIKKFDWSQILLNCKSLSDDFIEEFIQELGGWGMICKYLILNENFIRKHKYEVDWLLITKYQELSIPFICEFQHCLNWVIISQAGDLPENFLRFFKHKIIWKYLKKNFHNYTKLFQNEFIDYIQLED